MPSLALHLALHLRLRTPRPIHPMHGRSH